MKRSRGQRLVESLKAGSPSSSQESIPAVIPAASKKKRTKEPIPPPNSKQGPSLLAIFKALELTIEALRVRGTKCTFYSLDQGFRSLCQRALQLDDLNVILLVYPEAYHADWTATGGGLRGQKDVELTLSIPPQNNTHLKRIDEFCSRLDDLTNKYGSEQALLSLERSSAALPLKPTNTFNTLLTDVADKSFIGQIRSEKLQLLHSRSQELQAVRADGLEALRDLVKKRELAHISDEANRIQASKLQEQKFGIQSTKRIVGFLRSAAVTSKQSRFDVKKVIADILEASIEPNVTSDLLRERITLLSEIAPEFVRIIPRSRLLPSDCLQITLSASIQATLGKIDTAIAVIDKELAELTQP